MHENGYSSMNSSGFIDSNSSNIDELIDVCCIMLDYFGLSLDMPNGPNMPVFVVKKSPFKPKLGEVEFTHMGFRTNATFCNVLDFINHMTNENSGLIYVKQFVYSEYADDMCSVEHHRIDNIFLGCTSIEEIKIRADLFSNKQLH